MAASLDELAAHFAAESHVPVRLSVSGAAAAGPLPEDTAQHLQQILREALANASRHAGSCSVRIGLAFAPDELEMTVQDDGCGFAPPSDENGTTGHGVRNMRERARRLGGRLTIERAPAGGTSVAVSIPLDSDVPAEADAPTETLSEATTP